MNAGEERSRPEVIADICPFVAANVIRGERLYATSGERRAVFCRLVHFYHEVTPEELYSICSTQIGDVEHVARALRSWLVAHPERLDEQL